MTDLARLRYMINHCPGFLPTRDEWEEIGKAVNQLIRETETTQKVLEGTGHKIEQDERGLYFLHGHDCEHYPVPQVKGE